MKNQYVELDRTFHPSVAMGAKRDDIDLTQSMGGRGGLTWSELLTYPRVVILSGGGAGKTEEVRNRARILHDEGMPAFFLRIEHVCSDFIGAFDKSAGNHDEFIDWVESGNEGWVFLDSVDEARLSSPKSFELAIAAIGRALEPTLQQAHVIITGREAAWRARSDRDLVLTHLPYRAPRPPGAPADIGEPEQGEDGEGALRFDASMDDEDGIQDVQGREAADLDESGDNCFMVVEFDILTPRQVQIFAKARQVEDVPAFVNAIERRQAQAETARPLDLDGLIDYWNKHQEIGTQFELTDASINRRLDEIDPDRALATPRTRADLREAASMLAAASMLMQASDIRIAGASADVVGVEPGDILNWKPSDIGALLLKPLFSASQFGAVRFYVQKAREFLTAEWLNRRLVDHSSRSRIESLFFKNQYGRDVVIPSMRGVLPWLALMDSGVLARVRQLAPEVMFEGGDPTRLPLELRRELLDKACAQLADDNRQSNVTDFQAVQRFAAPDLGEHIKALCKRYAQRDSVIYFLMRMIWQGEISVALPEAREVGGTSQHHYSRLVAIRAVMALGDDADRKDMRDKLLFGSEPPERDWIAEVIPSTPRDADGIAWLLTACEVAKPAKRYRIDDLSDTVEEFVTDLPEHLQAAALDSFSRLLSKKRTECDDLDYSRQPFDWLLGAAIKVLVQVVEPKSETAFLPSAKSLLLRIPYLVRLGDSDDRNDSSRLGELVAAWPELNQLLFWEDVAATRARRAIKGQTLTDVWGVGLFGRYWSLASRDFDHFADQIRDRPSMDDRLVALSAAHGIYREHGSSASWRQRLHRRVKGTPELENALAVLFGPQSPEAKKWARQQREWRRRARIREERDEKNRKDWRDHLLANVQTLRTPFPEGGVRRNQLYLYQRMHELEKGSSRWTDGNWRTLVPEFGHEVATAFRDGAVSFWRSYTPELLSTGATANSTPHAVVYGLTGLVIESRESMAWAEGLGDAHASLATRYALHELNGFPKWLPSLFQSYPEQVESVVLNEISYELHMAQDIDSPSQYVLSDLSCLGSWMWPRLAQPLLDIVKTLPIMSAAHLRHTLAILAGNQTKSYDVAALARQHAMSSVDELSALWFAAWIGTDPTDAIDALSSHLENIPADRREKLAMLCITAVVPGRFGRHVARPAFRTAPHLTSLYLVMQRHVRFGDDIERAGTGAYSPTLRDEAQEARDELLTLLRDIPGQESYFALLRIAEEHSSNRGALWASRLAQARAVADSAGQPWIASQVRDFQEGLERTPRNHIQLHELAIDRVLDLKHFLEHGETSVAALLREPQETEVRNYIADWCRQRATNRYFVAQEEEFADKKRTDVRLHGHGFDNPVPIELKLSNLWTGSKLVERLENQLCNDYLRDQRSSRGIYLLMHQSGKTQWQLPDGSRAGSFAALVTALKAHWARVAIEFPHVHAVEIVGIDLTLRDKPMGRDRTRAPASAPEARQSRGKPASKDAPTSRRKLSRQK